MGVSKITRPSQSRVDRGTEQSDVTTGKFMEDVRVHTWHLMQDNPRYTYAGCYLGLIEEFDTETRTARSVKAYEELGLGVMATEQKYRFNWNAPIHVSEHDSNVIYHAAQVLLRSEDRGFSWTEVSPDLTRNEADKQGKGSGPYTQREYRGLQHHLRT